jgi:hypothetical protein
MLMLTAGLGVVSLRPVFSQINCRETVARLAHVLAAVLQAADRPAAVHVVAQSECQVSVAVCPEVRLARRIALDALSVPTSNHDT